MKLINSKVSRFERKDQQKAREMQSKNPPCLVNKKK